MRNRTAVRYEDGAVYISEPDPVEEIRIEYARRVVAAAMPNLEAGNLNAREARWVAVELARCVRELLEIVSSTRA